MSAFPVEPDPGPPPDYYANGGSPDPDGGHSNTGSGNRHDRRNGRHRGHADEAFNLAQIRGLIDHLPPNDIESEAALLGSMLLDWRVTGDVLQIVTGGEREFFRQAHGVLYNVLVELYDQRQAADVVQLHTRLRDKGVLEEVGGAAYLEELASAVPSAASANYYAQAVHDKYVLRQLIEQAGKIIHRAYHDAHEGVGVLLDQAEAEVFKIAEQRDSSEATSLNELVDETYRRLQDAAGQGVVTGRETGFLELDEMLCGMQNGELLIVAARPSMGKTAFALNIAEHLAVTRQQPVAVFSLEMSKQQLAQRLLASNSGVDSHRLRRNLLTDDDFGQLAMAAGRLSESRMLIDDTPGLTLLQLRAKARRIKAQHGELAAVFIDYLQLMSAPGAESRLQEVSAISRGVKALARELGVPVVCLSQLNRAAEQREGHKPRLSDLRESGSIEQDADVVMMLHREAYYHKDDPDWAAAHPDEANLAEVIVAKQRNGPTGVVPLHFDGGTTRFSNPPFGYNRYE